MTLIRTGQQDPLNQVEVVNGVTQVTVPILVNQVEQIDLPTQQTPSYSAAVVDIASVPQTVVAYHHTQNATSADWVIPHNLGFYPNVTAVDSTGTIVEGEIDYTSIYELTVHFTSAFSGNAYLS